MSDDGARKALDQFNTDIERIASVTAVPAPATTPQKLRDLAMYADLHTSVNYMEERTPEIVLRLTAALRTAADQLEAVRSWLDGQDSAEWDSVDLDALDSILDAEVDVS